MEHNLRFEYSIKSGVDTRGKFVEVTPPVMVDEVFQGFRARLNERFRMYTDELDLAVLHNISDDSLTQLITTAQDELTRRNK